MKRISLALALLLASATALVGQSFPVKANASGVVTEPTTISLANTALTLPTSFTWAGTLGATNGGTGQSTWTLGDFLYANGTNTLAKLAGNTSATLAVLTQTGTGTVSAAPVWTSTTGTGNVVRATSPTLVTPTLGAATATSITGAASTDLALNGGSGTSNVVLTASGAGGNVYARPGASGYVRVDTGLGMRVEAGTLNVTTTTPASSSTVGAFTVGNGAATTNVAIGGGGIWAGTSVRGGTATDFATVSSSGLRTVNSTDSAAIKNGVLIEGVVSPGSTLPALNWYGTGLLTLAQIYPQRTAGSFATSLFLQTAQAGGTLATGISIDDAQSVKIGTAAAPTYGAAGKLYVYGGPIRANLNGADSTWIKGLTLTPTGDNFRHVHQYAWSNTGNSVRTKWVKEINGTETDMMTLADGDLTVHGTGTSTFAGAVSVSPTALTGVGQIASLFTPTYTSAATSNGRAIYAQSATAAAAFTLANAYTVYIDDTVKGAGSTITNNVALKINNQTAGTNNYAIQAGTGIATFADTTPATTTTSGALQVAGGAGFNKAIYVNQNAFIDGAAGTFRSAQFLTANVNRWGIGPNNTAESGANAGSNLIFNRWSDAGADLGPALTLTRSTGAAAFAGAVTAGSAGVSFGGAVFNLDTTTNAAATTFFNNTGYAGGTTQFRSTIFQNGKGASVLTLDGPTSAATFAGSVTAAVQVKGQSVEGVGPFAAYSATGGIQIAGYAGSPYGSLKAYTDGSGAEKTIAINSAGGAGVNIGGTGAVTGGGLYVSSSTPSTGVGSGALQVAGGVYAGAASVFGGTLVVGNTYPNSAKAFIFGTLKVGGDAGQGTGIIALGDDQSAQTNVGIYRGQSSMALGAGNWLNIAGYDGVNITAGAAAFGSQTKALSITSTAATFSGAVSVSASQPNFSLANTGAGGGTWVSYVVSSTGRYTLQEAGVQDWFTVAKTTGAATFVGSVTAAYLNTVGGNAFNQFGSGTRTKGTLSGQSGEVAFDNGTVDSPGVHFYTGNNANYGIDATSSSGLRLIKNLDETSGTVVASFTDTAATFATGVNITSASGMTSAGNLTLTTATDSRINFIAGQTAWLNYNLAGDRWSFRHTTTGRASLTLTEAVATFSSSSYTTNIGLAPAPSIVGAYQVTSAPTVETPILGFGDGTRSGAIYGMQNGANISQLRFGHQQGSTFYESVKFYSGMTAATHVATFSGTTASTGAGFGALQVAGGAYFGAASVFGDSSYVYKQQNGNTSFGVRNDNGGTASLSSITVGNDTSNTRGGFYAFGTGYTTSNQYVAGSVVLESTAAPGMGISATNGGPVKIWNNAGTTATFTATGTTFASTLTTSAGRVVATSIKTTTYTVTTADHMLVGNHASTPFTITMIAASSNTGRQFIIKNKGVATVTVDATSLGTIDGSNSITLSTNQSTTLVSDGAQWNRI